MLTRIANSLYWTGRYLERSEHLARYLRVQYFSMQDIPMQDSRAFTLRSIERMYKGDNAPEKTLSEAEVLRSVGMSYEEPSSIRSTVRLARENARALRHVISTELWESINAFYLYSNNFSPDFFVTHGLHEFTSEVGRCCAIIRSRLDDTLLQDETWMLMKLGIHLERAVQVLRILLSKLYDIEEMNARGDNPILRQYQGTVILKILEGFDLHQQIYHQPLSPQTTVDFLVAHPQFARSATYNLRAVTTLIERLDGNAPEKNPVLFQAGKLFHYFRYLEYAEVEDDLVGQLSKALDAVYALHDAIQARYFGESE